MFDSCSLWIDSFSLEVAKHQNNAFFKKKKLKCSTAIWVLHVYFIAKVVTSNKWPKSQDKTILKNKFCSQTAIIFFDLPKHSRKKKLSKKRKLSLQQHQTVKRLRRLRMRKQTWASGTWTNNDDSVAILQRKVERLKYHVMLTNIKFVGSCSQKI